MKTARVIIGIISIVLCVVVFFQSFFVGVGTALTNDTTDTSAGGGTFLAIFLLIAGIVSIATKKSKGGGITAGILYLLAALIGFTNKGSFGDLIVWSILCLIFGVILLIGSIFMKKKPKQSEQTS